MEIEVILNHAASNLEKISINFFILFLFLDPRGLLCSILREQREQFFFIAINLKQIFAALITQSQQFIICSFLQQVLDDIIIELFLCFIHLHLKRTKIMQQREAILLINDPIQISPMLDQHVRYQETYLFILETGRLLNQSEQNYSQRNLVQKVWLVRLSLSQQKQTDDLVVTHQTGCYQRSLTVVLCLQVNVNQFVFQEDSSDVLQTWIREKIPKKAAQMRGVTELSISSSYSICSVMLRSNSSMLIYRNWSTD